jgi:hypothetical protein
VTIDLKNTSESLGTVKEELKGRSMRILGECSGLGRRTCDTHVDDTCCQDMHVVAPFLTASWTVLNFEHCGESLIDGSREEELLEILLTTGEFLPVEPLKNAVNCVCI